jgi:hypothetical protein
MDITHMFPALFLFFVINIAKVRLLDPCG